MRRVLPLGLLLCAPLAHASEADPWLGQDKALHFGVSVGLAGAGYGGAALLGAPTELRLASGAGLSLTLGLGKEVVDHLQGKRFSLRDLTWDVAGTATGLALSYLLDRFVLTPLLQPRPQLQASPIPR